MYDSSNGDSIDSFPEIAPLGKFKNNDRDILFHAKRKRGHVHNFEITVYRIAIRNPGVSLSGWIFNRIVAVNSVDLGSLEQHLTPQFGARLNYGLEKVRFPSPVPVGSRLRSHVRSGEVKDLPAGKQLIVQHTVEIEGRAKPACVAAHVVLLLA